MATVSRFDLVAIEVGLGFRLPCFLQRSLSLAEAML